MRYLYKCSKKHETTVDAKMGAAPKEVVCVECGEKAKKVIFSVPVIFKGLGFYSTDKS